MNTTATARTNDYGLSPEQVAFFEENGYYGPLQLCTPAEMNRLREWIDEAGFLEFEPSPIYGTPRGYENQRMLRDWHLVYKEIFGLCAHPVIIEAMASLMGPDLLLWRSNFTYKEAGGPPVGWHQDLGFPGRLLRPALEPVKNLSAWIAIDEATLANGCVRVVPGTHKQNVERRFHTAQSGEGLFGRRYTVEYVCDTRSAVPMVLKPGECFLFSERTLHGSTANPTNGRRLGLATRVTTPDVRVYPDQRIDGSGWDLEKFGCVLVHGEDRYGHNALIEPDFSEE